MNAAAVRVQIVGPDGAGKSTVVRAAVSNMADAGLRIRHLHFDPNADPEERAVSAPQQQEPRGYLGQALSVAKRLIIYWLATWSGGLSRRRADVVIQERGWQDQIIDPARYRLTRFGAFMARACARVSPPCDLRVLLRGDANAIVARKPELSISEVVRQTKSWMHLQGPRNRATIDSVTSTVQEVTTDFVAAIVRARHLHVKSQLRPVIGLPRRLEMVATPGARHATRSLYRPCSGLGRIGRLLALRNPFGKGTELGDKVAQILGELKIPFDGVAAIRSWTRAQGVISIEINGEISEFIRFSWDSALDMDTEARVLSEVGEIPGVRVPLVKQRTRVGDLEVLRLTAVAGSLSAPRFDPESALAMAVSLRWARGGTGVTHGDFTAWNVLQAGTPGLIDWERASLDFVPGADLRRYLSSYPAAFKRVDHIAILKRYFAACHLNDPSSGT